MKRRKQGRDVWVVRTRGGYLAKLAGGRAHSPDDAAASDRGGGRRRADEQERARRARQEAPHSHQGQLRARRLSAARLNHSHTQH